jgi:hypothetical protein
MLADAALDDIEDLDDDYEDDLPLSQVDFFAEPATAARRTQRRGETAAEDAAGGITDDRGELPASLLNAGTVSQPVHEPEPDPNDIMSFFEKPPPTASVPDTLKESMVEVSGAELLAEAHEILALARRGAPPS